MPRLRTPPPAGDSLVSGDFRRPAMTDRDWIELRREAEAQGLLYVGLVGERRNGEVRAVSGNFVSVRHFWAVTAVAEDTCFGVHERFSSTAKGEEYGN